MTRDHKSVSLGSGILGLKYLLTRDRVRPGAQVTNMNKLHKVEQLVRELYESKDLARDSWADALYAMHVPIVAEYGKQFAERFDGNRDRVVAACFLHDIADSKVSRGDKRHEEMRAEIARFILEEAGYSEQDIQIIIDDALRFHSCRGEERPLTLDGKIMATADAVTHLETDFYLVAENAFREERGDSVFMPWIKEKLDRDYYNKIFFDEVRAEVKERYEFLKHHFAVDYFAVD